VATPANPLDKYVTYTYHFELHAHHDWTVLSTLASSDANDVTDRFSPKGTLLINTRRDAHQTIDDVSFIAVSEAVNASSNMTPIGEVHMTIYEPGGFSFVEKLDACRLANQCGWIGSLAFALKIIFVGRTKDNIIETMYSKLLPLTMLDMNGKYTEQGGNYTLLFAIMPFQAAATSPSSNAAPYSFFRRNISFSARTIEEAMMTFQARLNDSYTEVQTKEIYSNGGKPFNYIINVSPEVRGRLDGLNKASLAPGEPTPFVFNAQEPIINHIYTILKASKELNDKVAQSYTNVNKEFQEGIFIPVVTAKVIPGATRVDIVFDILVNKGGAQFKYEFEYFFAGAGKNIDILSYDVKMNVIQAWMPTISKTGFDEATNQSGRVASERSTAYTKNICHADKTVETNHIEVERSYIPCNTNDHRYQPTPTRAERAGYINIPFDATASLRLASSSQIDFQSTINPTQVFEIRGHLDLLDACIAHPEMINDGGFFGANNTWIKVNIWMPDANMPEGKRPFYYTGYYRLLQVQNHFSGGRFTQSLTMVMPTPQ
jgi:hypothetical protein